MSSSNPTSLIDEALGCFDAAFAEGWIDALANGDIERIRDLWYRRIAFAIVALRTPHETSDDSRDAARYRWLRRRIARTIIARIAGAEPETEWAARPEALDGLIDTGIAESGSKSDPLADVRWICGSCTTVNGIDDEACLGCRKPREEHDRRAVKSNGDAYGANCRLHPGAMFKPSDGCPTCEVGGAPYTLDSNGNIASASTGGVSPPTPSPSPVECPKCRTQLAFEGDECGLCKEEES